MADQGLALKLLLRRIIHHRQEGGQDARFVARGECAGGAIWPAGLGLVPEHVRANKRSKHVGGRIGAEQHRPAILLFDDGRVAQRHESVEHLLRLAEQRVVAREGFEGSFGPIRIAA